MSAAIQLVEKFQNGRPTGMATADAGQRFLEFTFPKDLKALLPLGNLQSAIEIQLADILPVPQMSAGLLGILNWRGKAIWIADLSFLAGGSYYSQCHPQSTKAMVLVVQSANITVGLAIERTISVVARDPATALAVDEQLCATALRSFVGGYFLDDRHQPWLMLDVPKVFTAIGL
jgi:chemotaxis signal transduction protein